MWKILVSSLVASAIAVPLNVVHERRGSSDRRSSWETSNVDRKAVLSVRIGLAQRNLDRGYDHVLDVSDPESENYGKHWTLDEVNAEFAPADESADLVTEWLQNSGIGNARQTSNKGWITFDAPVHQIEELFNAEYRQYKTQDGVTRIGCDEYSLPQHLTHHIDYVTPGVKLSSPVRLSKIHKRSSNADKNDIESGAAPATRSLSVSPDVQNCGVNITPPCYQALYNLPAPGRFDIPAGEIGVFEVHDHYSQDDLNEYFAQFAPYVPNGTGPTLYSINNSTGPAPQAIADSESDLDFAIAYSLLGGVNISLYESQTPSTYDYQFESTLVDPFLDAIDSSYCSQNETDLGFQCGGLPLPKVLSASYGLPELLFQSQASQVRACNEFMKLSLQGHTIIFGSGDFGVALDNCVSQDNHNNTADTGIFSPAFPANCPYILSVGGTQLNANQTVNDPESVMNVLIPDCANCSSSEHLSSGGGFANYFGRPSYQDEVVQNYLDNYVPDYPYYESNFVDVRDQNSTIGSNKGVYNRNGRAIPDVSANGAYALFVIRGSVGKEYGTSLAVPIWASIVTMLNAERAAAGQPSVGFIHPILYKNPQAFNDITIGNNPGCGTDGFPAVKGWDPSTGLGTPDYPKLSEAFASAPGYASRK